MENDKHKYNKNPLIEYTCHLREGLLVHFKLPVDLTKEEVNRIEAYMNTLTVDSD